MAFHGQLGLTRVFAKEPETPQDWRNLGALEIPPKKTLGVLVGLHFFLRGCYDSPRKNAGYPLVI